MREPNDSLWTSIFALGFGICVLAFLTVIDRQEWAHIRPVSTTAVAMSNASTK